MNQTATPRSDDPSARSDAQELSKIVGDLRKDFAKLRDAVLDLGREKAFELKDAASETIEDRKRRADELTGRLCDTIREHPLKSVMIAAAAGVLYGMVNRRG
jgi:ElaB/YqjD/DUF883 family membrane-anchored ribosome-binding protein